jgi:hypothetical protein
MVLVSVSLEGSSQGLEVRNVPPKFEKCFKFKISVNSMFNFKMAPSLGKRKRHITETIQNTRAASEESSESQDEEVQDVFRRHFEAHFKPLPTVKKATDMAEDDPDVEDEDDTEWEGISEPEGMLQEHVS